MPVWIASLWYEIVHWSCLFAMTIGFSLRVRGRQRIPRRGPVLIVANHQSFLDPVLVGLAAPRQLVFLARKSLFRGPLGWFIRSLNAMPIDHEHGGKEGLQAMLAELDRGQAVVVFPEGTRTPDGQMASLKPGIYLLIKRARVPVIALGIAGAHAAWPRSRILPLPAPLFLPASDRTLAVHVGECLQPEELAGSRDEVLDRLFHQLRTASAEAEKLRRR